jgi:hypothetical protein
VAHKQEMAATRATGVLAAAERAGRHPARLALAATGPTVCSSSNTSKQPQWQQRARARSSWGSEHKEQIAMNAKEILINKVGTLMWANAELAAQNFECLTREKEHLQHIAMLKAELKRWQDAANEKEKERSEAVDFKEAVTENLPANPYETNGSGVH